jgi:SOS-response transcriptional repressor LexA
MMRRIMPGDPPTPKQRAFIRAFAKIQATTGQSPSMRELMAVLGFSSTNAVNDYLVALEKRGLAVRLGKHFGSRRWRLASPDHTCPNCGSPVKP